MISDALHGIIAARARFAGLDPKLVKALVLVESGGNPWAWNPEPRYRYLWDVRANAPFRALTGAEISSEAPPADFPTMAGDRDQEWWGQSASWGVCQVMGAVARERGFQRPYLTELLDPSLCLSIACAHLAGLLRWANGDVEQALAAYNGGRGGNETRPFRNADYAAKVLAQK